MASVEHRQRKEIVMLSLELVGGIAFAYVVWDSRHDRPGWIIVLFAIAAAMVPVFAIRNYLQFRIRAESDRGMDAAEDVRGDY